MRPRLTSLSASVLLVLLAVLASLFPLASPAQAAPFSYSASTGLPAAIPDNDGVVGLTNTMVVSGNGGTISDLNVGVQISHTFVGELIVSLTHDGLTSVVIIDRPGYTGSGQGCSGNDIAATLDDEAATSVEAQCAGSVPTINGTFSPNFPLSAFDGESVDGTWSLNVRDTQIAQTGSLTGWSISGGDSNLADQTLNVTTAGSGTGTVTDDEDGDISCTDNTGTCSDTYPHGTVVTLLATEGANSVFAGWSGDAPVACTMTVISTCDVTMDAAKNVTATFNLANRLLNVTTAGSGSGTVEDDADGAISCTGNLGMCSDSYPHGTVVTLTATEGANSTFTGWSGDVPGTCTTGTMCDVTMDADKNVTATFTLVDRTLTVTTAGTGTGTVTDDEDGDISCTDNTGTCSDSYPHGTVVSLTATEGLNSAFAGWSGADVPSACTVVVTPTCDVTMDAAKSITATFNLGERTLNVTTAGSGTGTVTDDADGDINCTDNAGTCSDSYPHGTVVTLTATEGANSTFTGWSGDVGTCTTATTCDVTMDAAKNVTATFTLVDRTLTVTTAGTGTGTVTDDEDGDISCTDNTGTCSDSYPDGTVVTLTATPTGTSTFAGWSGDVPLACTTGTPSTCDVTMDAAKNVTATFNVGERTLNVTTAGTGSGTVTDDADGDISCTDNAGTCSDSYPDGTVVTLTATEGANSTFTGWSGDVPGTCTTGTTCDVTMDADKNVTATFTLVDRTLTVTTAGTGTGTVTDDEDGDISCTDNTGTCSDSYPDGTVVTLTATPAGTSTFAGWSGDVPLACTTGTPSTCDVTMDAAKNVTATFDLADRILTVSLAGTGSGTVEDDADGDISCPGTCSDSYPDGTVVTLTATAGANSVFAGWSGDVPVACTTGTPSTCDVTMDSAKNVTATFDLVDRTLTVSLAGTGSGTVEDDADGDISCPGTCSDSYPDGTVVTLTATAASGSTFVGWSGDVPAACAMGAPATCDVTMSADRSVTATFDSVVPPAEDLTEQICVPMPVAPGWCKLLRGGATANVETGGAPPGWGTRALAMTTGSDQAVVSTDVLLVPGITKISSITTLKYWTFVVPNSAPVHAPTIQLSVDIEGDLDWDTTLVFEPAYNGNVVAGQWQQWNALEGLWYSTRDIGIATQADPATLREIFNSHGGDYFEASFSLIPSDPGGDLRIQYGTSGGGYPGSVARVDGVEFQLRNVPLIKHNFEGTVEHVVTLVGGLAA